MEWQSLEKALIEPVRPLLKQALLEDLGIGDITTAAVLTVPLGAIQAEGVIMAEGDCVIAGIAVAREVFRLVDPAVRVMREVKDGEWAKPGQRVAHLLGNASSLLAGERVALNMLQRLSGIATLTARFVEAIKGTRARIMDTRKTTPGWRLLEKYAVRMGGGVNHRMTLADGILIKDNHIALAGGVTQAIAAARRFVPAAPGAPAMLPIEVETTTLAEVEEAVRAGAPIILLDNFSVEQLREAVSLVRGQAHAGASRSVRLEASGGITLANVRAVAETGVDMISVGALTHSAPAATLSMDVRRYAA